MAVHVRLLPARAADATTDQAPDKRWSRVYQMAPEQFGAEPDVRPARLYGSAIQSDALPPQDSPDVAVMPSAGVTQSTAGGGFLGSYFA